MTKKWLGIHKEQKCLQNTSGLWILKKESRKATAPKGVGVPDNGYGGNPEYAPESLDVFDVIKGHLIDEGYADTEEAALVIMSNMSEEWRQSIVEDEQSSADARERNKRTQDSLDRRRSSDVVPPAPKLPPAPPERPRDNKGPASPGGAPAPRSGGGSVGRIPPRNNGGGSVGRNNGGGQITGNIGSPGTIGTIQGGKPGDGYLGPTVRIGNTTIGIPNPSPIRRGGRR